MKQNPIEVKEETIHNYSWKVQHSSSTTDRRTRQKTAKDNAINQQHHQQTVSSWHSQTTAAAAAKSLQSCLTLCHPIDGSPPGFSVPGIFQARTLEWVAISFSNAWKLKVKVKSLSRVRPSATPWTAAYQAPPSMGFSRQEYWSGVPLPSPTTTPPQNNKIHFIFKWA